MWKCESKKRKERPLNQIKLPYDLCVMSKYESKKKKGGCIRIKG